MLEGGLPGPCYFDHAWRGPVPASSLAVVRSAVGRLGRGRCDRLAQLEAIEATRETLSRTWLPEGWSSDQLAFTANTTAGIALTACAFPWRAGDRVLVHADEEPANVLPWLALEGRGVRVEVLPSPAGRYEVGLLAEALSESACASRGRVRVVSLAAVALGTGERRDLPAIARTVRAAGGDAVLVVDAAQALGGVGLDVSVADVVVGCSRKWLLGPPAVGLLMVRPGLLEQSGWVVPSAGAGSKRAGAWAPGARRLEGGALPAPLIEALGASAEGLARIGREVVEAQVLRVAAAVRVGARAVGLEVLSPEGSGIVHLAWPDALAPEAAERLERELAARGAIVRVRPGSPGRIRVSGHAWNTESDVAELCGALREVLPS